MNSEFETRLVSELRLDSLNPRLPETLHGASQEDILDYLLRFGNLEELAQSLVDNGYFRAEPLVVDSASVVLEGNRRLATLKLLLGQTATEVFHEIPRLSDQQREQLSIVPVVVVATREDADRFIAFRHIGGMKGWEPEAKARYVYRAIRELSASGDQAPFRTLASRVGSNAGAMRTAYLAMALLTHARKEFGIDVTALQTDRFGVWSRALSSKDIKDFMGLAEATSVSELGEMLTRVDEEGVRRVIEDLSPRRGIAPAIQDSRQLSTYGRILANEKARAVFSQFGYETAARVVELVGVADRIKRLTLGCKEVLEAVTESEELPDSAAQSESAQLLRTAQALHAIIKGRLSSEDNA